MVAVLKTNVVLGQSTLMEGEASPNLDSARLIAKLIQLSTGVILSLEDYPKRPI
jgi:hypothetical protein